MSQDVCLIAPLQPHLSQAEGGQVELAEDAPSIHGQPRLDQVQNTEDIYK